MLKQQYDLPEVTQFATGFESYSLGDWSTKYGREVWLHNSGCIHDVQVEMKHVNRHQPDLSPGELQKLHDFVCDLFEGVGCPCRKDFNEST